MSENEKKSKGNYTDFDFLFLGNQYTVATATLPSKDSLPDSTKTTLAIATLSSYEIL